MMKRPLLLPEKSACGVGFIASRHAHATHANLQAALAALSCQEHRGACSLDQRTSDGAGIMTDIPFDLLGYRAGEVAVAVLFAPTAADTRRRVLQVFEDTFGFMDLEILAYREVPIDPEVLGDEARRCMPYLLQAIIQRPAHCRTNASFDKLLYISKQYTRTKLRKRGLPELFFASLSAQTIVYKGLMRAEDLAKFYLDLQDLRYVSRFGLFHRRFSTNTTSTWDKAQPFRSIAHNGEFNTITGNRSWAVSRENAMGLFEGELLTAKGVSDSGSLNEMTEALMYRSSIPYIDEVMAILMPPAGEDNSFYHFWSRAMEPWDGPALVAYADGENIGARLDRNGFRPCRWAMTDSHFYLSSEAGSFRIDEAQIIAKGALAAGTGLRLHLRTGHLYFGDPSQAKQNFDAQFDSRTIALPYQATHNTTGIHLPKQYLFSYTQEDMHKVLLPMIQTGKEPIGSMGDTARLAVLSAEPRSLFDYFYHNFAQVTNPPLDYLRERVVTDLRIYLGRRPNIFAKKELLPPPLAYELPSPILSLGQMEYLLRQKERSERDGRIRIQVFQTTFRRSEGVVGCRARLHELTEQVRRAVSEGVTVVVLSDRTADYDYLPIPCLLAQRAVIRHLQQSGLRLKFSIVIDSGEIRNTHQVAATIGMGAAAVCPYLALEIARYQPNKDLDQLSPDERERNLLQALEGGLLKVMSKMGISVVRSYHSSQLFTCIGLGDELVSQYFHNLDAKLGGITLADLIEDVIAKADQARIADQAESLLHTYQYKEHSRGLMGEKHSMTAARSKIIHELVRRSGFSLDNIALYDEYLKSSTNDAPITVRDLFQLKKSVTNHLSLEDIQSRTEILRSFGSGAMSFGAISAEAQRDIFLAMREVGGRSNSGEGGENPYYFTEGITAHTKQIASARFGVTARYLITGKEIQIKIAQGAKPGEGGQLMSVKVDEHIAKARHSLPHVDLISPPPMHDIYSIEDLKQLIYELRQISPTAKVSVKLVSGANIGTIALGVAKAGADVIHISGGEGGTGAASLSSMKHAGIPWEFGLWEVHQALLDNELRHLVKLRVDGGLHSGREVVIAAILGAEEFDFGKLLLIAQGCVMARICEKNTCPTGIATHNPRFKAKYQGNKEQIVALLQYLAEDVRRHLQHIGAKSLTEIIGRTHLLQAAEAHLPLIRRKKLDLGFALDYELPYTPTPTPHNPFREAISPLNAQILQDVKAAIAQGNDLPDLRYSICTTDRATLTTVAGYLATRTHIPSLRLHFEGSAGQSFGAYLTQGLYVRLHGEANDSVGKTMSGGKIVICPSPKAHFKPEENVIIGNVALYGATGGVLYAHGTAADRFAVRNSGATAVVEGVGMHACEYMTQGKVVILGEISHNLGGGMTGGEVIVVGNREQYINHEYLAPLPLSADELASLYSLLEDYLAETGSHTARYFLAEWHTTKHWFQRYVPISVAQTRQAQLAAQESVRLN